MRTLTLSLSCGILLAGYAALACGNSMRELAVPRPNSLVVEANRAFRDGRFADAARLADKALANPRGLASFERAAALRTSGVAHLKGGDFAKSVELLGKLLEIRKEPFVRAKLAEAQLRQAGALGKAGGSAKEALEKLSAEGLLADADAWAALARARDSSGDPDGARKACRSALEIQAEHAESKELLASLDGPLKPSAEPVKLSTNR